MTSTEKHEFAEKLKNFSLKELTSLLTGGKLDKIFTEIVLDFICSNYEEIPLVRFNKSIKNIPESYPQTLKANLTIVKVCAREIIERLGDLDDVNSILDIEAIVNHQIRITKALINKNDLLIS